MIVKCIATNKISKIQECRYTICVNGTAYNQIYAFCPDKEEDKHLIKNLFNYAKTASRSSDLTLDQFDMNNFEPSRFDENFQIIESSELLNEWKDETTN